LLPQNHHKQLIVIDFEYASANTPGLEFANHFTEWCYNYHDTSKSWACDTTQYPTLEEQRRFVRSYLNHRPQFDPRASATPKMSAMDGLAKGSISEFLLDSRTPGGSTANLAENTYAEEEARREKEVDRQVEEILQEIRMWRVANSAQWVAWGIVQAKVPELDEDPPATQSDQLENGEAHDHNTYSGSELDKKLEGVKIGDLLAGEGEGDIKSTDPSKTIDDKRPEGLKAEALLAGSTAEEAEQLDDEEDLFDYLAYAQDRAMFFWGDLVSMGFVEKDKLPERLVRNLKIVGY
jgi:choline kinase